MAADPTDRPLVIFITKNAYTGSQIVSKANMDAICTAEASEYLGAAAKYVAVLSTDSFDLRDALPNGLYYYVNTEFEPMAISKDYLLSNPTGEFGGFSSIPLTIDGQESPYEAAWTGSTSDGVKSAVNCNNWSSSSSLVEGQTGRFDTNAVSLYGLTNWIYQDPAYGGHRDCNYPRPVYCVESPPVPTCDSKPIAVADEVKDVFTITTPIFGRSCFVEGQSYSGYHVDDYCCLRAGRLVEITTGVFRCKTGCTGYEVEREFFAYSSKFAPKTGRLCWSNCFHLVP